MTDLDAFDPAETGDRPLAGPQGAAGLAPVAGATPLPAPRSAAPGPEVAAAAARPSGPHTLQTTLLGPLFVPDGAARAAELEELAGRATLYATRARGDGTRRAYRSAWRRYETWCRSLGREPLAADPDTIAMYVVRCADDDLAVSSIRVALAAIRTAPSPGGDSARSAPPAPRHGRRGRHPRQRRPPPPPGRPCPARYLAPDVGAPSAT